jgi:membrane protein YdbS with pleckstrin-like domain
MPPEHRREVRVQSLITVLAFLLPSLAVSVRIAVTEGAPWVLVLGPLLVLVIGGSLTWLALKRVEVKGYALREHDIAYRSGLFWRKVVVLPFNRVQHVEVASGPLQRRFGLATLKFYTAGGSSVDLKIEGLLAPDAEKLRAHILARSELASETG